MLSSSLFAKRFTNQYCEFELPAAWECSLEGTEWVCQSVNKERQKEAIIILAAKKRGSQDSLQDYTRYLKQAKTFTLPGGKTQVSESKYTKPVQIKKHPWIDSMHMASEVPGFFTRYLATVKEDLGIAVTFSVSKVHYNDYKNIFDKIVQTLRVFRQRNVDMSGYKLKTGEEENLLDGSDFIATNVDRFGIDYQKKSKKKKGGGNSDMMMIGLLVAAAAGFIILKKKGKKGKGKGKGKKKK